MLLLKIKDQNLELVAIKQQFIKNYEVIWTILNTKPLLGRYTLGTSRFP